MSDQDRIRLAEAMGWENPHKWRWQKPDADDYRNEPPDPFTDANDDYAVLEWMRERYCHRDWSHSQDKPEGTTEWINFANALKHSRWYQIGDYARAALKVIDDE